MNRCGVLLALALALLLLGGHAAAQTAEVGEPSQREAPTRIALVADRGADDLAARFAAELRSLRFDVVTVPQAETPLSTAELEALARQLRARAAVRVAAAESSVDLWLINPTTHEVLYRRVVSERDPAVAVLRALEILRGSLVDLHALNPERKPGTPSAPGPARDAERAHAPTRPAFWLGLGAAALSLSDGGGPAWGTLASLRRSFGSRFQVHAEGLLPVSGWRVDGTGGYAKLRAGWLGLGASVAPLGQRWVTPEIGLGLAALALQTEGRASPGFHGESQLNWATYPHARAEGSVELGGPWRLRAAFLAGFVTPRPVLLFAEQRADNGQTALLQGGLSVELGIR